MSVELVAISGAVPSARIGDAPCTGCGRVALASFAGVEEVRAREFIGAVQAVAIESRRLHRLAAEYRARGVEMPTDLRAAGGAVSDNLRWLVNLACGTERPTGFLVALPISVWSTPHRCVKVVSDSDFDTLLSSRGVAGALPDSGSGVQVGQLGVVPLIIVGIILAVGALAVLADQLTEADVERATAARTHAETVAKIQEARLAGRISEEEAHALVQETTELAKASGAASGPGILDKLMGSIGTVVVLGGIGVAAVLFGPPLVRWIQSRRSAPATATGDVAFEFWDEGRGRRRGRR